MRDRVARGDIPPMLAEKARSALVLHAIQTIGAGSRPGVRSSVYGLDETVQFGIARAVIIDSVTAEASISEYERELRRAKVSRVAAIRWITEVKREYVALHLKRTKAYMEDEEVIEHIGDPKALMDRLIVRLALKVDLMLEGIEDQKATDKHATLRGAEVIANLADTLGKYAHKEVSTEKMRLALDAAVNEAAKKSTNGTVAISDLRSIIADAAGFDPRKQPAPRTAKEAA